MITMFTGGYGSSESRNQTRSTQGARRFSLVKGQVDMPNPFSLTLPQGARQSSQVHREGQCSEAADGS
jgi:hypothetical protein